MQLLSPYLTCSTSYGQYSTDSFCLYVDRTRVSIEAAHDVRQQVRIHLLQRHAEMSNKACSVQSTPLALNALCPYLLHTSEDLAQPGGEILCKTSAYGPSEFTVLSALWHTIGTGQNCAVTGVRSYPKPPFGQIPKTISIHNSKKCNSELLFFN